MLRCPYCNCLLDEYVVHLGSRDEPAIYKFEWPACGDIGDAVQPERQVAMMI